MCWDGFPSLRQKKLLETAGLNYVNELSLAHKKEFVAKPLDIHLSTQVKVNFAYNTSYNVAAKITGTTAPEEFLIYSAHWDHLGIGKKDEKGDSIYNGALDNASGTAGLLQLAKAYKNLKNSPHRSVLFLAVTAEEQGLLGSAYYAQKPLVPKEKTVANINMDGLNFFGKTHDIVSVGKGQSELEDFLAEEAKAVNRYLAPEPNPSVGYYFRSDHFHFAKIGIPALYTDNGIDHLEKGKEFGLSMNQDYTNTRYHRPGDEYDSSKWKLDGAIEDLILLFQVGKRVTHSTGWPLWKESSEFKSIRDSYWKNP